MLPTIPQSAIETATRQGPQEYFRIIAEATLDAIGGQLDADTMPTLSADQITLLAYNALRTEVLEGGFIQLIHNGYGPFIFLNPFAKAIRLWGRSLQEASATTDAPRAATPHETPAATLHDFSKLIYEGRRLFELHGEAITADMDDAAFMALYEQYPDFDDIDDLFIDLEDAITEAIALYISQNAPAFFSIRH